MAQQEFEITFKWENGVNFEMTSKKNSDPVISIIKVEENGKMNTVWGGTQQVCIAFLTDIISQIGQEMKAP